MAAGRSSTGISPRPMLMGAPRNALRAFNAGVSLSCLRILAHRLPHLFCGLVLSLTCLVGVPSCGLATGSWRTGRMAQHRQECIRLPYAAPEASRRAFFFKVQPQPRGNGNRERVSCFRCQGRFCQFMLTIEWMSLISNRRFMYSSTRTRGWPSGS